MDDSLRALEERLEQLVPKGLSDLRREQMEEKIDDLAGALEDTRSSDGWKWGMGAAAALVAMVVAFWSSKDGSADVVSVVDPAFTPVAFEKVGAGPTAADLYELMTMSYARRVDARTDQGWVMVDGGESAHRYWSYEVTAEEELMDEASGYAVRVISQHEEWVPVEVTSL
ncbi:MAG: hypothetical protein OSA48_01000 [Akkermansiaceae bacterium]|nr:hypothetical protein [Akkermansiaceae bacterium]